MMRTGLGAALLLCASGPVQAQTDLRTTLSAALAPVDHIENVANTLGCTALYRALALIVGPDSDLLEGFRSREGYMATVAGLLWVAAEGQEGQTPDDVFTVLLPPIDAATDAYLSHMDAVSAAGDAPFDDQILDDVDFCNAIYDALQ